MRLVLIGFMGSGKSTVGRRLAERIGLPFIDLDSEIERRAGATINEIFARGGEVEFRRIERETLRELLGHPRFVMAAGGGTLVDPAMLALARDRALVVWLNPTFATIVTRIGSLGKRDRPLFDDEASAFDLYRSRLPSYRGAHVTVDIAPDEGVEEVAARLELRLREHACSF